jgi:hypothetical protein
VTSSVTGVAAAANRRRRGSAPATTTPRRPARGLQTGSSGGRSPAASERRPRQHRIRRAVPSARAADAGVGLLAWRTRPTRRPETQPLAQRGDAARRGGARGAVARLYNGPRAAGGACCTETPPLKTAAARFSDVIYPKPDPVRFCHIWPLVVSWPRSLTARAPARKTSGTSRVATVSVTYHH